MNSHFSVSVRLHEPGFKRPAKQLSVGMAYRCDRQSVCLRRLIQNLRVWRMGEAIDLRALANADSDEPVVHCDGSFEPAALHLGVLAKHQTQGD